MKRKVVVEPNPEVGVIVGRFQVPNLHDVHLSLINSVVEVHAKTIIFLGLSPCKVTKMNPLDFEARKQMILQNFPEKEYPNITILYIKDVVSDEVWSRKLDESILDIIGPNQKAILYGGRDSFIKHYTGRFPLAELESDRYISGTEIRNSIGNKVKASPDFRAGVIWASYNQYPKTFPTVDIAVFNEEKTKVLLAKKPHEAKYRFIGGFAEPNSPCYEADARREVKEEANIDITDPVYIGSALIDDWRYKREVDKIKSMLFAAKYFSGSPRGGDDVSEVRWFDIEPFIFTVDEKTGLKSKLVSPNDIKKFLDENIVSEHHELFQLLLNKLVQNKINL